jgi:hypothetical protein
MLSVPSIMSGAVDVKVPELVTRLMRDFADGSIKGCLRLHDESNVWNDKMIIALQHVRSQSASDAIRLVTALLGQLNALVKNTGILLLFHLVRVAESFRREWPDVGKHINKYIGELLQILMGPCHPIVLIWNRYKELPESLVFFAFATAAKCAFKHVESQLGPRNPTSSFYLTIYLTVLSFGPNEKAGKARDSASRWTLSMLDDVSMSDYPSLQDRALITRCDAQIGTEDYNAAEQTLTLMESRQCEKELGIRDLYYQTLASFLTKTGKTTLAETSLVERVKLHQKELGATREAIFAFRSIYRYYMLMNRVAEARHWQSVYGEACREILDSVLRSNQE